MHIPWHADKYVRVYQLYIKRQEKAIIKMLAFRENEGHVEHIKMIDIYKQSGYISGVVFIPLRTQ